VAGIQVFITSSDSKCDECGENLGRGAWITLDEQRKASCLTCAELDHLSFLPAGDAALTRRAGKHSELAAVVLKWSRTRKRYERQGVLVTAAALELAEQECLADHDARARRQEREAARRAGLDQEYVRRFAARVREQYPHCPAGREQLIAEHACQKYSGRVGRSAAAKTFDEAAVRLAVVAHIRHAETRYDTLMNEGWDRQDARAEVGEQVRAVLAAWGGRE
jgi:hypothetical protein